MVYHYKFKVQIKAYSAKQKLIVEFFIGWTDLL